MTLDYWFKTAVTNVVTSDDDTYLVRASYVVGETEKIIKVRLVPVRPVYKDNSTQVIK